MFKKIILAVATFGIICVAYVIYQWQDATTTRSPRVAEPQARPVARRAVATQPAASRPEDASFSFKGARIPPGESPRVSVFDDKGNARYVFQCTGWKPLSDNEFHITNPTARLLLPGGQLAYVWADEGQVVFQRGDGNALNPKSGWLRGHVRIFIDRTKPKDREENPERAALEQHPEAVVKIWLEDVSFDLDLDRLDSKGPVVVQSVDASIEGEGLELIWNEVDRRVRLLQINKGKRATLHSSKLAKFSFAGNAEPQQQASAAPAPPREAPKPPPQAQPVEDDRGLAFQNLDAASAASPKDDRVDTYRIEFQGGVSARQTEGAKVVGSLTDADMLELLADIGREDRDAVEHAPGTGASEPKAAQTRPSPAEAVARSEQLPLVPVRSMVELEWSGKLIARPLEATEQPAGTPGERLHLVARGAPVTVRDEQNGEASCTELEYHGETKQIWLRGTEAQPVRMDSASRGRLTVQKMTFDPKTGIASVDGPGRMISDRRSRSQEPGDALEAGTSQGEISWARSALLEFGRVAPTKASAGQPQPAGESRQRSEYIKRAVFDGNVAMREGQSSIAAGHLEAFFAEPQPGTEVDGLVATKIAANDNVMFEQRSDRKAQAERVECDRLEVEMDGTPDNLPKIARAFGNVIASQRGERSAREIRAHEQLELTLASVPRPITPEERQRLEVMARQNPDVKPGSPKWVAMESKLAARRRTVAQSMTASGQVVVNIRDGKEAGRNLGLIADTLDCTFSNGEEIERARVVGSEERPASVDTGDVYVKGPQIVVDMDAQLVEVPGGGLMRFMTREDLDGRAVDRPVPVVVSWKDRMVMRGKENRGTFTGSVRAASETTILDCRELRIEFQDVARADAPDAGANAYWVFGPVVSAVGERAGPSTGGLLTRQMRKRPVYLWAVGDAVIESSSFEQGPERGGAISGAFFRSMPMAWQASRPETGKRGRLLSRLRAAGPQIRIDLVERHFGIEGVGNMSIEDYRIPQRSARSGGARTGSLAAGRISGGLDSLGPSQTVFTWQSSMTYLNHRNLAVFDDSVKMNHVSGGAMVMKAELAAAMNLDADRLGKLESRQARLDCDNLLVEFDRDRTQAHAGPSPLSRATKLKRFEAKGAVQLALDGGRQAVTGTVVTYASESGEVKVTGSPAWPAQILEQDERTAKLNVVRAEPGKAISWNEKTRIARIEGSSLLGTGR